MIEKEVIEGKITRAQQVLDRIEGSDFSQKRFLRLDQDVSDRMQAAQFLANYARVGFIKERLLGKSLPKFQAELAGVIAKEPVGVGEPGELLVSPVPYNFDRENKTLQVGDVSTRLNKGEFLIVDFLYEHRGRAVDTRSAREMLSAAGYRSKIGQIVHLLEGRLEQEVLIRIGPKARGAKWALGVLPEEEEIEQAIHIAVEPGGEVIEIIPYEPSEEELRSEQETKILDYVASVILTNRHFKFEDLQAALATEERIRQVTGRRRIAIYQSNELRKMFSSALSKIREEAVIPHLRASWSEQDERIWEDLQKAIQKLSGRDIEDFSRKVGARIDAAQREFYLSLPPEERNKRVYFIQL